MCLQFLPACSDQPCMRYPSLFELLCIKVTTVPSALELPFLCSAGSQLVHLFYTWYQ